MTRKKLGLGLLETFSEACEVCAGRGVIVHHDAVTKHRSNGGGNNNGGSNGNSGGSGNNGGNGRRGRQQQQPQAPAGPPAQTHVITEGVKSALAQIAASTIHAGAEEVTVEETTTVVTNIEVAESSDERGRPKRKKPRQDAKPRTEKDLLLDSVLSALPEPKAPGQGRGRRRVSTAALTGTPVVHDPDQS
jgi:ribonuclease E